MDTVAADMTEGRFEAFDIRAVTIMSDATAGVKYERGHLELQSSNYRTVITSGYSGRCCTYMSVQ